jgi:small subunit ribosomal protein S8
MLIRIKNAYMARKQTVEISHSNVKEALVKLLERYGYVGEVVSEKESRRLTVVLKYVDGVPALTEVKRLSKPGLRRYIRARKLSDFRAGLGQVILSTPQGLKTHTEAKKAKIGGEVLCTVW